MKVILFGDELGLGIFEQTLIDKWNVCATVVSSTREAAIDKAHHLHKVYSIPFLTQPHKKNSKEFKTFLDRLRRFEPDLIFANSYSRILSDKLLTIPRLGSFNVHAGLLPRYRGANIINWVLINGETEAGVTIHKITPTIDTGPIILSRKIPIEFDDTVVSLREKLKEVAHQLVEDSVVLFEKEEFSLNPQTEEEAGYWPRRKPEDGYFSWKWDELSIYNLIRALVHPWPGAFTIINGKKTIYDKFLSFEEVKRLKNEHCCSNTSA